MRTLYRLFVLVILICLPMASYAFPPKKGDKDCIACHTLNKKDAEVIVKKLAPNGTVMDIKVSPAKGVWQIDVDAGDGRHGSLFLDFSKKYLIVGQLVPIEALKPPAPQKVDLSRISLADAVVLGPADAKKKVIVFTDPDCPYCRELHKTLKLVLAKRSDISFSLVLIALPMHKDAPKKVQSILCSKSVSLLDDAFAGKEVPEATAPCTAEALERNKALATTLNFNGTPTLVRDDGMVLSGALPEEKLLEWIDRKM